MRCSFPAAALALTSLTLGLAACGSDSDDGGGETMTAATITAPATGTNPFGAALTACLKRTGVTPRDLGVGGTPAKSGVAQERKLQRALERCGVDLPSAGKPAGG